MRIIIKNQGTVDCEVRLQLTKDQIAQIRSYFGKEFVKFATSAVYSQGYGWYHIYGDDEHIDAALVGLRHLQTALERKVKPQVAEPEVVTPKNNKRYLVEAVVVRGHKQHKAINREIQALLHKQRALIEDIKHFYEKVNTLAQLANKWGGRLRQGQRQLEMATQ